MDKDIILDNILDITQQKYDRACYMYGRVDPEDGCMWILGLEVYWALANMPELHYPCGEDMGDSLYGLPCLIDRKNEWRISLVKEIE